MELKINDPIEPSERPTKQDLSRIKPNITVRLQLTNGARFWCLVTEARRPNGVWPGVSLDTVLPVKRGDRVCFGQQHVYQVL